MDELARRIEVLKNGFYKGDLIPAQALQDLPVAEASTVAEDRIVIDESDHSADEILRQAYNRFHTCMECALGETRTNFVFGVGNASADIVFVGEAPGQNEDEQGEPFIGRAGNLLTKALAKLGVARNDVYITNIIKCRPPENRNPTPEEIEKCSPIWRRQLEILKPKVFVCLGAFAAQTLLVSDVPIGKLRGQVHDYNGIHLIPTFHPAYILRSMSRLPDFLKDLKSAIDLARGS